MPPVIADWAARRFSKGIVWSGDYDSWSAAEAASSGYHSDVVLDRVRNATLAVKEGRAAYERDSVLFDEVQYSWPLLAGLLWVAARHHGTLDVLDFGGALGSSFHQNRRFLASLDRVRWNVVEQPNFVDCGRQSFETEQLRFYRTIDDCLASGCTPQVLVLSSVLQYLPDPHGLLDSLRSRFPFIIVDLTLVHDGPNDRLTVQTVPSSIYPAAYPCWALSQARLLSQLQREFAVVATFDSHIGQDIRIGRLRARYRGLIGSREGAPGS
jgi:putative methyltransferase (TIGR04325 family)